MKLHIVSPGEAGIVGYQLSLCENGGFTGWDAISDNECEMILANHVLDNFALEQIPEVIQGIVRKLRTNGRLNIGGTDIRLFARQVVHSLIPEDEACKLIGAKRSMSNSDVVKDLLVRLGLKIESYIQAGAHYELTCIRN